MKIMRDFEMPMLLDTIAQVTLSQSSLFPIAAPKQVGQTVRTIWNISIGRVRIVPAWGELNKTRHAYLGEELGSLINQTGVDEGNGGLGWRGPMHVKGTFSEETPGGYSLGVESIKNIEDGTSRTLMAGEQTTKTNPRRRSFWAYTWGGYSQSQAWMDPRMFSGDYLECAALPTPESPDLQRVCQAMWYSYHTGGGNFLRCDGSVSFIHFDVDLETFGSLCSIAGGEIE